MSKLTNRASLMDRSGYYMSGQTWMGKRVWDPVDDCIKTNAVRLALLPSPDIV